MKLPHFKPCLTMAAAAAHIPLVCKLKSIIFSVQKNKLVWTPSRFMLAKNIYKKFAVMQTTRACNWEQITISNLVRTPIVVLLLVNFNYGRRLSSTKDRYDARPNVDYTTE